VTERLFFVVSGEHPTLPHAEIRAILQATGVSYKEFAASPRILRLEAETSALDAVAQRSMMYDQCGVEIGATRPARQEIVELARSADLAQHLTPKHSYAVRSLRIGGALKEIRREDLEREIGHALLRKSQDFKVDLTNPDVTFLCIVSSKAFILGRVTHSRTPGLIASRRPRKRPVFHPSTMQPKLARCLVNLARPPRGGLLMDPFCGVGGIILEAAGIGCEVIGSDADIRMIRGARSNLRHYKTEYLAFLVSDATSIPVQSVESIVTDPPYGREASTRGRKLRSLLEEFLPAAYGVLARGGFMCICCPSDLRVSPIIRAAGFEVVETHRLYVHKSLTRRIIVLKKS